VIPAAALAGSTSNSQTFNDSRGEDAAAPDIAATKVSNDDTGLIAFEIEIPNRPAITPDMVLLTYVDSAPGAGDPDSLGADWVIQLEAAGATLFKWSGSDYTAAESQSTLSSAYGPSGARLGVNASELGAPKAISFATIAISGLAFDAAGNVDFANAHRDIAPDNGFYSYEVRTTFSLKSAGFAITPAPPRAGASFSVGLAATQSDTAGYVRQGAIACTARVGGAALRITSRRLVNGVAACAWSVPKTAAGKTIRGSITLTVKGAKLTKSFSVRVR
jgi:hypothetical protein